jgi:chromate transporter
LRGVRAAVVGLVFAAAIAVGKTVAPGWVAAVLFMLAFIALVRYRVEAVWIVPLAGFIGFLAY